MDWMPYLLNKGIPKKTARLILHDLQGQANKEAKFVQNDRVVNAALYAWNNCMTLLCEEGYYGEGETKIPVILRKFAKLYLSNKKFRGEMAQAFLHYFIQPFELEDGMYWDDIAYENYKNIGIYFLCNEEGGTSRLFMDYNPDWKTDERKVEIK